VAGDLDHLLARQTIWRGRPSTPTAPKGLPTGLASLDAVLPTGGWLPTGLNELLLSHHGIGELELVWPALARLAHLHTPIVLVDPPYLPYTPAWDAAGLASEVMYIVDAEGTEAMWATEQCLRSGACGAVLCWPKTNDQRVLRRLQIAAETGRSPGFVFRHTRAAANPSPAPLRIAIETAPDRRLRVLKCRGANPPTWPVAFPRHESN